jgi:hypothetical protein
MSVYISQSRSNYFHVRSPRNFRRFCSRYGLELIRDGPRGQLTKRHGFVAHEAIPTGHADAKGEWIETDFIGELAQQLARGEVAIVMEAGSEKMRYLIGYACAVNWKGERIQVALTDIYRRAKQTFGVEPTLAEY